MTGETFWPKSIAAAGCGCPGSSGDGGNEKEAVGVSASFEIRERELRLPTPSSDARNVGGHTSAPHPPSRGLVKHPREPTDGGWVKSLAATKLVPRRMGSDAAGARASLEAGPLRRLHSLPLGRMDVSMKLRLRPSDPETCDALVFFLRRHDCRAEVAGNGTVLVGLPHPFHQQQARMELCLYIRLWQVLHGVSVRIDVVGCEASTSAWPEAT